LSAVPGLILALQDEEENVRIGAMEALGDLADARAIVPLTELLSDPSWVLRYPSAEALGKIGDPAALPALEHLLLKAQDQGNSLGKEYMIRVTTEAISRIQARRKTI
jgi:HEAT repeat protein